MSEQPDYSDAPNSPLHPDADQEVQNLPEKSLNQSELDLLDLNPDLDAKLDATGNSSTIPSPGPAPQKSVAQDVGDRVEDFQPVIVPSPVNAGQNQSAHPKRRLSSSQQTRFIGYVDEQLLHVQRRFVQSFGLSYLGYKDIDELLKDLKQLINFVWLSIDNDAHLNYTVEQFAKLATTNFGQTDYLIRIAGDSLEYIEKLDFDLESAPNVLKLLDSLDQKLARLIDGRIPGGKRISNTDTVRIHGIAERARFGVVDAFEKRKIEGFHYELSKIYERVLDRVI